VSDEEKTPAGGPLAPIRTQEVDFYGDAITGLLVQPGTSPAAWYVPLRPLSDHLGLNWAGQLERTRRDEVLSAALRFVRVTRTNSAGGNPNVLCIPLEYLPGWLFGITPARVKPELAAKITRYRRDCFRVLWDAFQPAVLVPFVPTDPRLVEMAEQIDSLAGTAAFLREHMADIVATAGHIADVSGRLDQTVSLLEAITEQQQVLHTRQDTTEARLERVDERTSYLTPAHKRAVQTLVEQMVRSTKALPQPLTYARIYGRIKYRFNVGSYAEIPDDGFDSLMA